MTSICPASALAIVQPLLTAMADWAAPWQVLAPAGCRLALLDLRRLHFLLEENQSPHFPEALLSQAEHVRFQKFRYGKRRLEWLGGRLAAKQCVQQLARAGGAHPPPPLEVVSIEADASGRPRLAAPDDILPDDLAPATLSISHSDGFAAALACRSGDCGIDIQQISAKLASVRERFTTEEELGLIEPGLSSLAQLGLIWATKEAVKKCLLADHPSFFGAIRLIGARKLENAPLWTTRCRLEVPHTREITVRAAELDNYWVACCASEDHA